MSIKGKRKRAKEKEREKGQGKRDERKERKRKKKKREERREKKRNKRKEKERREGRQVVHLVLGLALLPLVFFIIVFSQL